MEEEKILGNYKLIEEIGRGGMGVVYKAYQANLNRYVALKVLPTHLTADPEFVKRFYREAKSAARLNHPNIIQIYDIGEDKSTHFFAMEYVEGEVLSNLIRSGYFNHINKVLKIVLQVSLALECAFEHNIIHRDIKPSNIIVNKEGKAKVADFGLAKAITGDIELTSSEVAIGTPKYMSPEQGEAGYVDIRSDIYSLGLVFYEMLTGQPPFQADTPASYIYKHVHHIPLSPSQINQTVPPEISHIVLRTLAKSPNDRYQNPSEFKQAIRNFKKQPLTNKVKTNKHKFAYIIPIIFISLLGTFFILRHFVWKTSSSKTGRAAKTDSKAKAQKKARRRARDKAREKEIEETRKKAEEEARKAQQKVQANAKRETERKARAETARKKREEAKKEAERRARAETARKKRKEAKREAERRARDKAREKEIEEAKLKENLNKYGFMIEEHVRKLKKYTNFDALEKEMSKASGILKEKLKEKNSPEELNKIVNYLEQKGIKEYLSAMYPLKNINDYSNHKFVKKTSKRPKKIKITRDIRKGYRNTHWGMSQKKFLNLGKRLTMRHHQQGAYLLFAEQPKNKNIKTITYYFHTDMLQKIEIQLKDGSAAQYEIAKEKFILKYGEPAKTLEHTSVWELDKNIVIMLWRGRIIYSNKNILKKIWEDIRKKRREKWRRERDKRRRR
jgi:serine/threonine protein kinase